MTLLETIKQSNHDIPYYLWKISAVTFADDESVPVYVDRNRVGAIVRCLLPLEVGYPLHLLYVGGEKDGGVIEHSRIQRIESDEVSVKVYTRRTMVKLVLNQL